MISVTILVKNGEKTLFETLSALRDFDEVLLLDTGSTDRTLEIAKQFPNVTLHQRAFLGFGTMHNVATSLAKHDWILSIDADEVMTPGLKKEILALKLDEGTLYSLPRDNYFNGKKIKWCGWQNERCIRLYNRTKTCFSEAKVHEGILTKNLKIHLLQYPLKHTPYHSISDFLRKMEHYSTLFAEEKAGKKHSSPKTALLHGLSAFFKSYFLKRGFLGGYEGLLISLYNGHTAYYKYLKLYHRNASLHSQM
jgi:glycosyltransferase involved in cell wall biosynthesis